jgi:hypothetical protein
LVAQFESLVHDEGHAAFVPSHTYPPPHDVPWLFGANVHAPPLLQPVHVWHACAAQALEQQSPLAPPPVSAPQVNPEEHSRQLAALHVDAVAPAVVLHAPPLAIRTTQVPAPLQ